MSGSYVVSQEGGRFHRGCSSTEGAVLLKLSLLGNTERAILLKSKAAGTDGSCWFLYLNVNCQGYL